MKTVLAVAVLVFVSQGPRSSVSGTGTVPSDEDGVFDPSRSNLVSHQREGHQSPEERASQNNCSLCELALNNRTEDPVAVCQAVGLCPLTKMVSLTRVGRTSSSTKVKVIKRQGKVAASLACVLCEFVMNELDKILVNNSTEATIEAALEVVCNLLPSILTQECTEFVNSYGPLITQLLMQEVILNQICTVLGLC